MKLSEVLEGKAGLAGVHWVLNGRAARQALRRGVESMLSGAALGSCQIQRVKFKPGRYLTAYYEARLCPFGAPAGPGLPRMIEVTWRPPAASAAPEPEAARELQEEAALRGLLYPFRQLSGFVPEWGMSLRVFPLDEDFPQLVRLSDPAYARELLASAPGTGAPVPGASGEWPEQVAITPIRYRPRQRHVLRYDYGSGTVYAKLYKDGAKAPKAFQAANWASDWFAENADSVVGSRPLAYLAEDGVILYPKVEGIPLSQLLKREGGAVSQNGHRRAGARRASVGRALQLAGSALRSIHSAPTGQADQLVAKALDDEIRTIDRASEHFRLLLPDARERIEAILEGAQAYHDSLPQEPPTFAHSDFKSDHLLVTPETLTIIDFDTSSLTDPALDIGKFLADLDWWYTLYNLPGLEAAQAQFLAGYGDGAAAAAAFPEARMARARLYETLVLVRIAVRRVPLFSKTWAELTTRLMDIAEGQWYSLAK